MLNQNAIIIIDVNGNVLREPIGSFRANSNYTSSITVIAPFELDSVVSANYSKKNRKNDDIAQFLIPNGNKKGKDIIGENDPLYQLIHNWHVFEADVDQLAVAYFAKYRSDMLFVSIGVGNIVKPAKAITYKGEFGTDSLLPEVSDNGDYYISKNYNFMDKNIQWTLNDYAYYDNGWKKSNYRGEAFTEPIELLVDPAIEANYEIQEDLDLSILLAGRLAIVESRVNVVSELVDTHIEDLNNPHNVNKTQVGLGNVDNIKQATKTEFDAHKDNKNNPHEVTAEQVDTYVKTTIDLKDANTLQQAKDYTYSKVEIDNKDTAIMNKANNLENANMFKDVNYNNVNGVLTFTKYDDTTKAIDLPLELLVESGFYDAVTNELVLVLANGSDIRIPVGNLLTDLDAHNIRFNGSGTNYLTAKTEVESAVKELDTRVKANADNVAFKVNTSDIVNNLTSTDTNKPLSANQGKVLNDTVVNLKQDVALHEDRIDSIEELTRKQNSDIASVDDDGIGILHMGKDVAETTVTTKIDGLLLDAPQLVTNGDFSDGTAEWGLWDATGGVTNGVYSFTATTRFGRIHQNVPVVNTNKYYVASRYKTASELVRISRDDNLTPAYISHGGSGNYELVSGILTSTATGTVNLQISDWRESDWTQTDVDYIFAFNISTLIANKQYSPLYNTTFDLMSDAQIKIQMDTWVQDGTLPNDIQAVDFNKRVRSVGKNLFDKDNVIWGKFLIDDNTPTNFTNAFYTYIRVKPNTQYRLKGTSDSNFRMAYRERDINKQEIGFGEYDSFSLTTRTFPTFTTSPNTYYLSITQLDLSKTSLIEFQLEEGTVATTYEPYRNTDLYIKGNHKGYRRYDGIFDYINCRNGKYYFNKFLSRVNSIDTPIEELNSHTLREVFGNRNIGKPNLEGKEYLGDGIYKLTTIVGVDIYYNVYNGVFTFNGVSLGNTFDSFLSFEPLNGIHSLSVYYVSGEVSKSFRFYFAEPSYGYTSLLMGRDAFRENLTFNGQSDLIFNTDSSEPITFDNYQLKIKIEKGDTATPYQVPNDGPYNTIDVGVLGLTSEQIDYWFRVYQALLTSQPIVGLDKLVTPIETEIATIGNAIAYPNGTFLIDDMTFDVRQYTTNITVSNTDYPIKAFDEIYKLNDDGSKTKLSVANATIASDGLSFTHTGLASGDIVSFTYTYIGTNIKGLTTVYYYGDKMIVAGSGTTAGKVYKIVPTVVDENIVWTKVEV